MGQETIIIGPEALKEFRGQWPGTKILSLLKDNDGKLLVTWPVGIGKSFNIDDVIEASIHQNIYDLVIVLTPTSAVLQERRMVQCPAAEINMKILRPRPVENCGRSLDKQWKVFEQNSMGALGKQQLCKQCSHYQNCYWPLQYGKNLENVRIIFGNQVHLQRDPHFIQKLKQWSRANNILLIMDESNFISINRERKISSNDLRCYQEVIQGKDMTVFYDKTCNAIELLLMATTSRLNSLDWKFPFQSAQTVIDIQRRGFEKFGSAFRFIGYDLQQFANSSPISREKKENGDIHFAISLGFKSDLLVYSGTVDVEYAADRLGSPISAPFKNHCFKHPGTVWFNFPSKIGMKKYFMKNSPQILDFFASLIVRRLNEGKKVLLISKKIFKYFCAKGLEERIRALGLEGINFITEDWFKADLNNHNVIPVIHYGVIGVNIFEHYDAAYCLNGFYTNEQVINERLQDCYSSQLKIPIEIGSSGTPPRRWAKVRDKTDEFFKINKLLNSVLFQEEMGTVLQTVGRVRPYTKSREIITFQCSEIPQQPYTYEFTNLQQARNYFDIKSYCTRKKNHLIKSIKNEKRKGQNQKQVAQQLGKGLRTVQRYWKS